MTIIVDTNLLVRMAVDDNPHQRRAAAKTVAEADAVVISCHSICEMAWVLRQRYAFSKAEIGEAIQKLCEIEKVVMDRSAVEAGLDALQAGGDFADGVVLYEGQCLGGEIFVSFDKKAVAAVSQRGMKAELLV
jgi:predicted nucleic-acid-binding protein